MKLLFWALIGVGVAAIISLFFEEGREGWEDAFEYIITFEWWEDFVDFFGGLFESLDEFSVGGLIFGICSAGLIYILREQMLNPFLVHMGGIAVIFWAGVTYFGTFLLGYLVGKRIFDD